MGTAYTREGHTISEYHGSRWVERYLGAIPSPYFRRFREMYLSCIVGNKPVFAGEDCPGMFAESEIIWFDNPLGTVASWDPYTVQAFQTQFKEWFGRPFHDPAAHPNELVRRAWRHYAARALSDYYRWNKATMQRLAQPKRRVLLTANLHTQYTQSTYELWLMNLGALDCMDNEEATHYGGAGWTQSPRYFVGYKMGLAAGNGRSVWRHFGGVRDKAESMACLSSSPSLPTLQSWHPEVWDKVPPDFARLNTFLLRHQEIYGNAQPGGSLAVLLHLRRSLEACQITKLLFLGAQLQRLGIPFEVIVEDDLT